MKNFPVTVVDNFYETPDLVREFALSSQWQNTDGRWPGQRTAPINEINPKLFDIFSKKMLSLFYDFEFCSVEWIIDSQFQKVPCFSNSKKDCKNDGWIHTDDNLITGVIYLNPNPKPGWGTSIYALKDGEIDDCNQEYKFDHYLGKELNEVEHEKQKIKHNNKFIETIKVENVYNRLILFESKLYHGVPTFYSNEKEERLTQVIFVEQIGSKSNYPVTRMRNGIY